MLVLEHEQALILKLKKPRRVLETIPTATPYMMDTVRVPHRDQEVKVLNNLGIKAPHPVNHYYSWPGRYRPYDHQRKTVEFLIGTQRGIVLNDIGTGKTQSALWAADYLMRAGVVSKVLILSPLSTLDRVWGDGIFETFPDRSFAVLHGTAQKRKKLLGMDHDFYVINHDGFNIIADLCLGKFDLVIVDEAAVYRNSQTSRYKKLTKWLAAQPNVRLWLMTGTPTPNAPTDAWALGKLIGNKDTPRLFSSFRDRVMYKAGQWKWVPKPNASLIAHRVLAPSVRFARDECVDLPETVVQTRGVALTKSQQSAYAEMAKELVIDLGADGYIDAANEAVKTQKLIQVCAGVVYDSKGKHVRIDCDNRINVVKEIIGEVSEKVIVFVPLTGALKLLAGELSKDYTTAVVNGEVTANARSRIFNEFQNAKDPRVLLAHPGTMAHGLTLTSASTIIWFVPTTSNEIYTQANGRIERIGKRHTSNVIHIAGTTLETMMYDRLMNKQRMQGVLLDLISRGT